MKRTLSLLIFLALTGEVALAQFNKKINFNAFIGTVTPGGKLTDADEVPYAYSNFQTGPQIGLGIQYNVNANLSIGINTKAYYLFQWNDPLPDTRSNIGSDLPVVPQEIDYTSFFLSSSLGLDIQYKFLKNTRINPYIIVEGNINLYTAEIEPRQEFLTSFISPGNIAPEFINSRINILRFNAINIESELNFGTMVGAGTDIRLSNTFGLFVQGVLNTIFSQNVKEMRRAANSLGLTLGIRFSLFKSKSLIEE